MLRRVKPTTRSLRFLAILITAMSAAFGVTTAHATDAGHCGVVDIDGVGWTAIESVKRTQGAHWWIELDDRLLVCGTVDSINEIAIDHSVIARPPWVHIDHVMLSRGRSQTDLEASGFRVISSSSGYAIVDASMVVVEPTPAFDRDRRDLPLLTPLPHDTVVLRQQANAPTQPKTDFLPESQALVDQVNGNRWFDDVVTLSDLRRRGPVVVAFYVFDFGEI